MNRYSILIREACTSDKSRTQFLYIVRDRAAGGRSVAACTNKDDAADIARAMDIVETVRLERERRKTLRPGRFEEITRPTAQLPK